MLVAPLGVGHAEPFLEVPAAAEGLLAGGGEHHAARVPRLGRQVHPHRVKVAPHLGVQRVRHLRAVQPDLQHMRFRHVELQGLVVGQGHGRVLPGRCRRSLRRRCHPVSALAKFARISINVMRVFGLIAVEISSNSRSIVRIP